MAISNGYCTLNEFKSYQRVTTADATDDGVIEDLVEAASRYIDRYCVRKFYTSTATSRYFNIPDGRLLWLDADLLSIDALGFVNGDGSTIASTEYTLLPYNETPYYAIRLKDSSSTTWETDSEGSAEKVLTITGTWGYASAVPDDIKGACLMIAEGLYKRRFGENTSGTTTITGAGVVITPADIPVTARAMLDPYRRLV